MIPDAGTPAPLPEDRGGAVGASAPCSVWASAALVGGRKAVSASFYSWAPPSGLLTASPAAFGNPGPFTGLPSLVLQPFPSTPPLPEPFSSPQPQANPRSSGLPPHPDPIPIYPFCLLDLLPFVCFRLLLSLRLPRKITSFSNILHSNSFIANFWSHHGPDSGLSL